jgi:hypothetical protein
MASQSCSHDSFEQAYAQRMAAEEPSEDQIRERAYRIYLARNGSPNDALSDWLEAQEQLRAS